MQQNFFDWSEQEFNRLKQLQVNYDIALIKHTEPQPTYEQLCKVEDGLNRLRKFRESLLPAVKG